MSDIKRYRKKPVEIEAAQWDGTAEGSSPIINWILANGGTARFHSEYVYDGSVMPAYLSIDTLEGSLAGSVGDWIIRGVAGEFYPCRSDIFEQTYEEVTGDE